MNIIIPICIHKHLFGWLIMVYLLLYVIVFCTPFIYLSFKATLKKNSHGRLSGHQVSFLQYLLSLASNVLLVNLLIAMLTLFLW